MSSKPYLTPILLALALSACGHSEPEGSAHEAAAQGSGREEGPGAMVLGPAQLEAAGIELASAGPARIRETLPLYGVIAPNASRLREVAARYPGVIHGIDKNVGDPVKQGDVLATVESNDSLETYAVTAPLDGVVTARNANPGEQTGEKPLFTVADLSTVWVELSLFPRDVAKVRVGQGVRVKNADIGQSAESRIVYVAPFGQADNQTLIARAALDNAGRRWVPGLYVTAEVVLAETRVPLAVRNEAVQNLDGRSVVFVQGEGGFEPRPVRLGRGDSENSEVLGGIEAGERYAARNSYVLKAELGKGSAGHGD
jgi:cobalt-zinc-cadmium efflux system membrane fusion protein